LQVKCQANISLKFFPKPPDIIPDEHHLMWQLPGGRMKYLTNLRLLSTKVRPVSDTNDFTEFPRSSQLDSDQVSNY
jgi:hypothetical protein